MYGAQPFYPSGAYAGSDLLAGGNWFGSGNVAMVTIHQWYMGWGTADMTAPWDLAPVPSYEGTTTAKLHADTFGIMQSSQHPEEAFEVLSYLLGDAGGRTGDNLWRYARTLEPADRLLHQLCGNAL